jgi:hypothetical protein
MPQTAGKPYLANGVYAKKLSVSYRQVVKSGTCANRTKTDHIVFKLAVLPLNHERAEQIIYPSSLHTTRDNLRELNASDYLCPVPQEDIGKPYRTPQ